MRIHDDDPLTARYVLTQSYEMGRDDWRIRVETRVEMHSDEHFFYMTGRLTAYENGIATGRREWNEKNARDLM